MTDTLLNEICALETALQQSQVRNDRIRLDGLLHESFEEIGRSGRHYCKATVLQDLSHALKAWHSAASRRMRRESAAAHSPQD
ncbi:MULTISPECIES: nuclear transport factor 2 family protein [Pseudomonas]|uniref:DUF4440 domain-containing protein n=1 Tax=Pseudomonas fluorescens TaxID=294 RepID=A0A5E6TXR2_PSEFL|nr:hypothetical protein PS652_03106 [Pseudomonas fluorescens]